MEVSSRLFHLELTFPLWKVYNTSFTGGGVDFNAIAQCQRFINLTHEKSLWFSPVGVGHWIHEHKFVGFEPHFNPFVLHP